MNYGLSNFSSYCYSVLKIKKKKTECFIKFRQIQLGL